VRWAVEWRLRSRLEGDWRYFVWDSEGNGPRLFWTRRSAVDWIRKEFGVIACREGLRIAPHSRRWPRVVRVRVELSEVAR
jgi:hypothetical protein